MFIGDNLGVVVVVFRSKGHFLRERKERTDDCDWAFVTHKRWGSLARSLSFGYTTNMAGVDKAESRDSRHRRSKACQ